MAHQKHPHPAPTPPGNRPPGPPTGTPEIQPEQTPIEGEDFQDQDPKRRLGNYAGAGEHAIQQPGGKNDANR